MKIFGSIHGPMLQKVSSLCQVNIWFSKIFFNLYIYFPGSSDGKESDCSAGDPGSIPGWEDPLEKGMTTHSSILAGRIPWIWEPGGLQSVGSQSRTTKRLTLYNFMLIMFNTLFKIC